MISSNNIGSDTIARFRYQAEVTLPFCVSALQPQSDIKAIVPEYLEDIALDTRTGWRFIQVKSRNPELGLWKATDLLSHNGALRSLYRTYRSTKDDQHSLEIVLEGAVKSKDPIEKLRLGEDFSDLVPLVVDRLGATPEDSINFLKRVTLNESAPSRQLIHACNARLLHESAPSLNLHQLNELHDALLKSIEEAMRGERLGAHWAKIVLHPEQRSSLEKELLEAKTLTAHNLTDTAKLIRSTKLPLLQRFVEPGSSPVSALTQKMTIGGATDQLIEQARNLKANAEHHRLVRASSNLQFDRTQNQDLHERIRTYVVSANAFSASSQRPAIDMWTYLLEVFTKNASNIDRHSLLAHDPMLLMGETCILSNQCEFTWGERNDVSN